MSAAESNRTVVVTGATRGIGRGLAIGLAESGMHVIATGRSQTGSESLESTQRDCVKAGGSCETFVVDHGNDESVRNFFEALQGRRIDAFVNNAYAAVSLLTDNAGVPYWERKIKGDEHIDPGRYWDIVNGVGLRGNYVCSVYATRLMKEQGGVIVNVTSWGGFFSLFDVAYGIGKQGIDRLAAELANECPDNIKSIAFCPGYVGTEAMMDIAEQSIEEGDESMPTWNMESPVFVGRTLAALLPQEKMIEQMHGKVVITAEVADRLRVNDENGFRALSFRSLRFALKYFAPFLNKTGLLALVPRTLVVPWWILRPSRAAIQYWN